MTSKICPHCGRGLIAYNYCIFCRRIVAPSQACELYKTLLRDIEDLSLSNTWREHWYYSAQHLKTLEPELYYAIMARAREYNERYQLYNKISRTLEQEMKYQNRILRSLSFEIEDLDNELSFNEIIDIGMQLEKEIVPEKIRKESNHIKLIINEMFNRHGLISTKEMAITKFAKAFTAIEEELATPELFD